MAMKASEIRSTVRGIIIDRLEDGRTPFFSEAEVITAINAVKGDMWGRHPEAFCENAVSVQPPSDIDSTRDALEFTDEGTVVSLDRLVDAVGSAQLSKGSVSLNFMSDNVGGSIFYAGDSLLEYCDVRLDASGITVTIEDTTSGESVELVLSGSFMDARWHALEISNDGAELTVTCDEESDSEDYTGALLPSLINAYLGHSPIYGEEDWFGGAMNTLLIEDDLGDDLVSIALDDGTGFSAAETVNSYDATVFGPTVSWLTDEDLPIADWAVRIFCFGVAAFLLTQRSKDEYFRKVGEKMNKLYLEM